MHASNIAPMHANSHSWVGHATTVPLLSVFAKAIIPAATKKNWTISSERIA